MTVRSVLLVFLVLGSFFCAPVTAAVSEELKRTSLSRLLDEQGRLPRNLTMLQYVLSKGRSDYDAFRSSSFAGRGLGNASVIVPFSNGVRPTSLAEPRLIYSTEALDLFIGAIPRKNGTVDMEFLSRNRETGLFDFGEVDNYGTAQERVRLVPKSQCTVCHRNAGPMFMDFPWANALSTRNNGTHSGFLRAFLAEHREFRALASAIAAYSQSSGRSLNQSSELRRFLEKGGGKHFRSFHGIDVIAAAGEGASEEFQERVGRANYLTLLNEEYHSRADRDSWACLVVEGSLHARGTGHCGKATLTLTNPSELMSLRTPLELLGSRSLSFQEAKSDTFEDFARLSRTLSTKGTFVAKESERFEKMPFNAYDERSHLLSAFRVRVPFPHYEIDRPLSSVTLPHFGLEFSSPFTKLEELVSLRRDRLDPENPMQSFVAALERFVTAEKVRSDLKLDVRMTYTELLPAIYRAVGNLESFRSRIFGLGRLPTEPEIFLALDAGMNEYVTGTVSVVRHEPKTPIVIDAQTCSVCHSGRRPELHIPFEAASIPAWEKALNDKDASARAVAKAWVVPVIRVLTDKSMPPTASGVFLTPSKRAALVEYLQKQK